MNLGAPCSAARGIAGFRPGHHRQPLLRLEPSSDPHGVSRDPGRRRTSVRRRRRRVDFSGERLPARRRCPSAPAWRRRRGRPTPTFRWASPPRTSRLGTAWAGRTWTGIAQQSHERALAARGTGFFDARNRARTRCRTVTVVSIDDGPRPTRRSRRWPQLKPAFLDDGKVTAGNACPLNDGAAAVVVMDEESAASWHPAASAHPGLGRCRASPRS